MFFVNILVVCHPFHPGHRIYFCACQKYFFFVGWSCFLGVFPGMSILRFEGRISDLWDFCLLVFVPGGDFVILQSTPEPQHVWLKLSLAILLYLFGSFQTCIFFLTVLGTLASHLVLAASNVR